MNRSIDPIALTVLLLCCLLLAGCGQKGDLYLPDEAPTEEQQGD